MKKTLNINYSALNHPPGTVWCGTNLDMGMNAGFHGWNLAVYNRGVDLFYLMDVFAPWCCSKSAEEQPSSLGPKQQLLPSPTCQPQQDMEQPKPPTQPAGPLQM